MAERRNPRSFLEVARREDVAAPVADRVQHYREFVHTLPEHDLREQAGRCMDCGIPFCHRGCPLENLIPEWNELVHGGEWDAAARVLAETNNFPEVTGRVCPAPCEASCVLSIDQAPVTIKSVEHAIADHALLALEPRYSKVRTGKTVAVIGSGPAGLAAAQELARKGHDVTVFERDDRLGGLLRYGIPDFKLDKAILAPRLEQLVGEGVTFRTGVDVGNDVSVADLRKEYDAIVVCTGARMPRELAVSGRALDGVHLAMEYLTEQNRTLAGDVLAHPISARGKSVIVIGGGDTGSDCVGTAVRQGAKSVLQLELMPKPPLVRMPENPWPEWPLVLRTSTSHEEGALRDWAVSTKAFLGDEGGKLRALSIVRVRKREGSTGGPALEELAGSEAELPCELALLAMGFVGDPSCKVASALGIPLDARGVMAGDRFGRTSIPGVFVAGDCSRGASLVVWAIADGRRAAESASRYLLRGAVLAPVADHR